MISIGIDVSKGKSTVCILAPYGELIKKPFSIVHTKQSFDKLSSLIKSFDGEKRLFMESTGIYHLPILEYFSKQGFNVFVINPLTLHKYANMNIRPGKTDILDSYTIANYGLDNWLKPSEGFVHSPPSQYGQLRFLSRQYNQYISMRVKNKLILSNILERVMPKIESLLQNDSQNMKKDKLNAFVNEFQHYDNITQMTEDSFVASYRKWAIEKQYQPSELKARQIYALASSSIPTLSSIDPSVKMLTLEAIRTYREICSSTEKILSQMIVLAMELEEFRILTSFIGIGDNLAARFIAEIGDIHRFHSAGALIAYAGIDAPSYQSGQFTSSKRRISKRGSKSLRKVGYEIMASFTRQKPLNDPIYQYIKKKEAEGKPKKVAKIAGLNKFFRIYYARVYEIYSK